VIRGSRIFGFVLAAALAGGQVTAQGLRVRSTLGSWATLAGADSVDATLGYQNRQTLGGGIRVIWAPSAGPFRFEIHNHTSMTQGGDVAFAAALAPLLPAPPPATLFDLTQTWLMNGDTVATNTFDRLNVSFTSPNLVLRAGRQAITWGSGTVFHPGDIVAPFAPNAVDTTYKTGVDMIYAQYLFQSGADIQAIAVPRPAVTGGPVVHDSSTFALRSRAANDSLDASVLLARDRGDLVAGLGLGGALGGASWNAEYLNWQLAGGGSYPSWLFSVSNFGALFGSNIAYFAEYFHNGFGVSPALALDALPASLTKRLATGQVFFAGTDFLALGAQVQLSPDVVLAPNAIVSLNDHSVLAGLVLNVTLGDNTDLVVNATHPMGSAGTEFGGRETSAGSGVYLGPAQSVAVKVVHFF